MTNETRDFQTVLEQHYLPLPDLRQCTHKRKLTAHESRNLATTSPARSVCSLALLIASRSFS